MSGSVNRVMIIGNLGADPDVRTTASGQLVCTLSLATSENFTDKAGVRQERTEWHRVVLWGKSAELAQRYLAKGRKVYIEGRLTTRKWQDKDGHDRYSTEVVANQMVFLDSGDRGGAGQGGGREQGGRGGSAQQQSAPPASQPPAGADPEFFDEDVPF